MDKIQFEKINIQNVVVDEQGNMIQEGTKLEAALFNRYEETISKLVEAHNLLVEGNMKKE